MFCRFSQLMFRKYLQTSPKCLRTIRHISKWRYGELSSRSAILSWARHSPRPRNCTLSCVADAVAVSYVPFTTTVNPDPVHFSVRKMSLVTNKDSQTPPVVERNVHIARMMLPDDANPLGVVHGGVVLQIMEQAGLICSSKYCNDVPERDQAGYKPVACALVRVERMMFLHSISIGDFVEAEAEVTYTSPHSLSVSVKVYAQNIFKGLRQLTNHATLWYVPVQLDNLSAVSPVPPLKYGSPETEAKGKKAYEEQKKDRADTVLDSTEIRATGDEKYTVAYSQTTMTHLVLPSHCGHLNYCLGGSALKAMDECAGITAAKHCLKPVLTLSLDTTNFMKMSKLGDVLSITSRVTFNSQKTLEVECLVDVLSPFQGYDQGERSIEAYFTFVCIDGSKRPLPMPPLKIGDKNEELRFQRRQLKYLERVKERQRNKETGSN